MTPSAEHRRVLAATVRALAEDLRKLLEELEREDEPAPAAKPLHQIEEETRARLRKKGLIK